MPTTAVLPPPDATPSLPAADSGTAYDRFIGRWTTRLAPRFLKFAALGRARRVLDVGAGTGALTAALAKSSRATQIIGIDPRLLLVCAAQKRVDDPRVTFDCADPHALPYPSAAFDASLAQLAFPQVTDCGRALAEMHRVTRPGGTIAACIWDAGPAMAMFTVLHDTLAAVDPLLALRHARRHYATRDDLLALWHACGMADVDIRPLRIAMPFAGFDDFWTPFATGPSRIAACVRTLSPAKQIAFRDELQSRLLPGEPAATPFTLTAAAIAVRGRVAERPATDAA